MSRAFITKPRPYMRPEQNKSLANVCFPSDLPGSFEMSRATPRTFLYSQVDQSTQFLPNLRQPSRMADYEQDDNHKDEQMAAIKQRI